MFVHANDFGDQRHLVQEGMAVEYEVEEGDRGLKVSKIRILDGPPARGSEPSTTAPESRPTASLNRDDDGMCDVLRPGEFIAEVTEMLVQHVPSLTGAQIAQVRQLLLERARSHGWVEA